MKGLRNAWRDRPGIHKAVLTLPKWESNWTNASATDFDTHPHCHIWRISVKNFLKTWRFNLSLVLSENEKERAKKIKVQEVQSRFVASRGALRCLLGEYVNLDPLELSFSKNRWGKPSINSSIPLHFNLSHSGDWILIAISFHRPVGIDLEKITPGFDYRPMVEQFFHPEEKAFLGANHTFGSTDFFKLWTKKEALAKSMGLGLHERLLATNMLETTLPRPSIGHNGSFFAIHSFDIGSDHTAALAVRNDLQRPKFFNFP